MRQRIIRAAWVVLLLLGAGEALADLVAYYEFDSDVSDSAGYAGGPYHGTLHNGAGVIGGELSLDGQDDYASLPAFALYSNTVTISAWIKRTGQQNKFTGIVLNRSGNSQCGIHFGGDTWNQPGDVNELRYSWNDVESTWQFASGLIIPDNEWTFVGLILEPTKATLYKAVDGVLSSATNSLSHGIEEFDDITWIGRDIHADRYFKGAVDNVRIYNEAVGEEVIRDIAGVYTVWNPNPGVGEAVSPSLSELSWTRPAPRHPGETVTCDVWFGTDETMATANKIVDKQVVESTSNFILVEEEIYYWRVDTYDPNDGNEVFTTGPVWNFNTINTAPEVDAGRPEQITWPADTVNLDGVVSDDGLPQVPGAVTVVWSKVAGPCDVDFSAYSLISSHVETTATFHGPGYYVLRLDANDGALAAHDDVVVTVYADTNDTNWRMAGANPQRTSWVPEEVRGGLSPVWYRPIEPYISQNVQIIASEGKIFVSTARGLYAFDAADGTEEWVYPTEMPLGHSPTYDNGVLYVGGFDRKLHAIDAVTGARLWTFADANAGYRTNPLVVEGLVMSGNRDGWFYAVRAVGEPNEGELVWKYRTDGPILYSAAYCDGVVFFSSQDMHCYALYASDGALKWKSDKLHGEGFNSWWPVIYRNKVVLTTVANYRTGTLGAGSAGVYHDTGYGELDTELVNGIERDEIWPAGGNWIDPDGRGYEPGDWAAGTQTLDASKAIEYFEENTGKPWRRNRYFLDIETGADWGFDYDGDGNTEYAPILTITTKNGLPAPPMVSGYDDVVYMSNTFKFNTWICRGGQSGWKMGTPFISYITEGAVDEPRICSGGGDILYENICCDREARGRDLANPGSGWTYWSYSLPNICPGYDQMWFGVGDQDGTGNRLWGYYGSLNGIYHNHTADQNPFVPYNGRLYIHRSNAIICLGGGGAVKRDLAEIEEVTEENPVMFRLSELKQMLADEIQKWLDAGHLQPGYFNNGQFGLSGLKEYFENPADNIRVLLRALPHLPAPLRADANSFIQSEYSTYTPTSMTATGWDTGVTRDWFRYPPEVEADFVNYSSSTSNFSGMNIYALWKYAEEFGGALAIYNAVKSTLPAASYDTDHPYKINESIAGHRGYLELEALAGEPESVSVRNTLGDLLAFRAANFSKDTPFAPGPSHNNRINISRNFIYLTEELGEYMHDNAFSDVSEAVEEYNYVAPYWFVSRYEGCLQESGIQNLHDYYALFQAKAWILQESREELMKYLGVPGFMRGDVYYIHNLISLIEAQPEAPTISPDGGGIYINPVTVTISKSISTPDAIHYTTDSSEPNETSTLYTGPFPLSSSVTLKARAYQDGEGSEIATAEFTINTGLTNEAPIVNAGSDKAIGLPDDDVELDGTVTDTTLPWPPGVVTTCWSKVSGPNEVIFEDANAVDTTAYFSQAGTYTLELRAGDGVLEGSDEVTITVNPRSGVQIATGLSTNTNLQDAATEAAQEVKAGLGEMIPEVLIISEDLDVGNQGGMDTVLAAISAVFPGVPIFGRGDKWDEYDPYNETEMSENDGLGLVGIAGVDVTTAYVIDVHSGDLEATLRAKGQELANNLGALPAGNHLMILFGEFHASGVHKFVPGVKDVLGNDFPLICGSSNDWEPYIYQDGQKINYPAQAIVLSGDFNVNFAIATGSSPSLAEVEAAAAQNTMDALVYTSVSKGLFWFNCATRKDGDLPAHLAAVKAVVGNDLPIFGHYAGGEAGKASNAADVTTHNGAGVFALLYDYDRVVISPNGGGVYIDAVTVALSIVTQGASIYYTLDSSEPNVSSNLYTVPFELSASTTVKARAFSGGNGGLTETAEFIIDIGLSNEAPVADAGNYQETTLPDNQIQLNGTVTDGTLPWPPGVVATTWSVIAGPNIPGTVSFDDANAVDTTVTLSEAGSYLLRLTADDGELSSSDEVYVFVNGEVQPVPVTVVNHSFELDAAGNPDTSFTNDFLNVQAWTQIQSVDGGVEPPKVTDDPTDGYRHMYGKWDIGTNEGDTIYQILNHSISAGDEYTLTFSARSASSNIMVQAQLVYDNGSMLVELAGMQTSEMSGQVWDDYTVSFTAQEAGGYIGEDIGILFEIGPRNSSWSGWACVDNVRLEVVSPKCVGDITGDGKVNYEDLDALADDWLWDGAPGSIDKDIIKDGHIDFTDFGALANEWLCGN